jgi:hypothetical protein
MWPNLPMAHKHQFSPAAIRRACARIAAAAALTDTHPLRQQLPDARLKLGRREVLEWITVVMQLADLAVPVRSSGRAAT